MVGVVGSVGARAFVFASHTAKRKQARGGSHRQRRSDAKRDEQQGMKVVVERGHRVHHQGRLREVDDGAQQEAAALDGAHACESACVIKAGG